jgi:malignant T-cell-amplified sequence
LRVYNLSKTAREEVIESLPKISDIKTARPHDLKIAESDDPNYTVVFDESEKMFLGKKKDSTSYFPLLKDESMLSKLPSITVDSGAIKFVCNGANIMRPGISKIEGDFQAQDLVLVKEQKYGKSIAVGRAMLSKPEMESASKGAVVTNLHYVGDKFWDMLKELLPATQ